MREIEKVRIMMIKSACDAMKKSIVLSAFFLLTGTLLEMIALLLSFETMIPVIFIYVGIFLISMGLIIFLATFIVIMIPKVNQQLEHCQH